MNSAGGFLLVLIGRRFDALLRIRFEESSVAFRRAVITCPRDAPRSGLPGTLTAEQIVGLMGIAGEAPEQSGRPVTNRTGWELADEARTRGLVESLSTSQVNRSLREIDLLPHHNPYWCNTTEKDPTLFARQDEDVCQTYLVAPRRYEEFGLHTVSLDEMSDQQAIERLAGMVKKVVATCCVSSRLLLCSMSAVVNSVSRSGIERCLSRRVPSAWRASKASARQEQVVSTFSPSQPRPPMNQRLPCEQTACLGLPTMDPFGELRQNQSRPSQTSFGRRRPRPDAPIATLRQLQEFPR